MWWVFALCKTIGKSTKDNLFNPQVSLTLSSDNVLENLRCGLSIWLVLAEVFTKSPAKRNFRPSQIAIFCRFRKRVTKSTRNFGVSTYCKVANNISPVSPNVFHLDHFSSRVSLCVFFYSSFVQEIHFSQLQELIFIYDVYYLRSNNSRNMAVCIRVRNLIFLRNVLILIFLLVEYFIIKLFRKFVSFSPFA
jgi:hypothetical protein